MAEYKALAQNTMKITTEMTLHHNTELGAPLVHNHPRVKAILLDGSGLEYYNLMPSRVNTNGETNICEYAKCGDLTSAVSTTIGLSDLFFKVSCAIPIMVDGCIYYGQKSAMYNSHRLKYAGSGSKATEASLAYTYKFPAAKVKAVLFLAATGTIGTQEFDVPAFCETVKTYKSSGSNYYSTIYSFVCLSIRKEENDVVLAIEVEYPKHDVTISNAKAGLQYSLDDGLTFQDVTDNMILSQVEHVVFKNVSGSTKTIGTTPGGSEVGTIAAGATFVAVPEADGTWYIS